MIDEIGFPKSTYSAAGMEKSMSSTVAIPKTLYSAAGTTFLAVGHTWSNWLWADGSAILWADGTHMGI